MASAMANMEALKGLYDQLKTRMNKTVDDFRANLVSVRTGRASVHMLDQVKVDYYGTDTPIAQVAQVTTPEANLILVQPWEISLVGAIEKAAKDKLISADDEKRANEEIQALTDGEIKRVEELFKAKEKEVLTL